MNNNLTYTHYGDYEIPNLILSETEAKPLGKYGRMRKNYYLFAIREHTGTILHLFKEHALQMQKKLQMSFFALIEKSASIW